MRVAYADPPYLGLAKRFYGDPTYDRPEAHRALVDRLVQEFPDGWAVSLHEPALGYYLGCCPPGVRVGAWVKPFVNLTHAQNGVAHAWEPVIFWGGRKGRRRLTAFDWCSCPPTKERGLVGAKPDRFCWWVFQVLGLGPEDELADLFPGSGAVTRAWEAWRRQYPIRWGAGLPAPGLRRP
ncbi:MAG: hypothetical protein ACREKK_06615 [Candidatus Methylomirabilales bacterium]